MSDVKCVLDGLNEAEKTLLLQMAILPPPVSFDVLFHTLPFAPTKTLSCMENLMRTGVVVSSKSGKLGHYRIADEKMAPEICRLCGKEAVSHNAAVLIQHYESSFGEGPEKWCTLAYFTESLAFLWFTPHPS